MPLDQHLLTVDGAARLRAELAELTAERESAGRDPGSDANEDLAWVVGRIAEIEDRLASATVVDPAALPATGTVTFGSIVELRERGGGSTERWMIVGDDEADLSAQRLSRGSPLAHSLVGRRAGDHVEVLRDGTRVPLVIVRVEP